MTIPPHGTYVQTFSFLDKPNKRIKGRHFKLWRAGRKLCGICQQPLSMKKLTIDHVVPTSRGGENIGNRVCAHKECNNKKGNRLPNRAELEFLINVNAALGIDKPIPQFEFEASDTKAYPLI